MYDLVIEDATIVSSKGRLVADIATKGGTIAYVGPRARGRAKHKISAIGKFLMRWDASRPGFNPHKAFVDFGITAPPGMGGSAGVTMSNLKVTGSSV